MATESIALPSRATGKLLAVLSLGLFRFVPFSPLLSLAAIKATEKSIGWPRRIARTGAFLSIAWLFLLVGAILWIANIIIWQPELA